MQSNQFNKLLGAAHNELEDVPYMDGKSRMSIFHSFLRFVIWSFLEEVMAVLVSEGQSAANLET